MHFKNITAIIFWDLEYKNYIETNKKSEKKVGKVLNFSGHILVNDPYVHAFHNEFKIQLVRLS